MTRITVTGWPPLCDLWFALSSSALRMWYVVFDLGDKCCWNEIFAVALSFLLCSWKVEVLVTQSCLTLCDPMYCSPPGSSVHEILQVRILEWIAFPFSRGSSQPKHWTQVSWIAGGFFTEPWGKPKDTKLGSLFLLQQIVPTQELNWSILHWMQILYQGSHPTPRTQINK